LYVEPGNKLSTYSVYGKHLQINCEGYKNATVNIYDSKKNLSSLSFVLKRTCKNVNKNVTNTSVKKGSRSFSLKEDNSFKNEKVSVFVKKGSLYTNIDFTYKEKKDARFVGGKLFFIHNKYTPLHKSMALSIKIPNNYLAYKNKLLIVSVDGKSVRSKTTKIDGSYLTTKTKDFGAYSISIDTVPPVVKISKLDFLSGDKNIIVNLSDDLSGISSYKGYIDGQWILLQYDYKKNRLYYNIDNYTVKLDKTRTFSIIVKDASGNITKVSKEFEY